MKNTQTKKKKNETTTKDESFAERATLRYKEAEELLNQFMTSPDNLGIVQEYHSLVESRNALLDEAIRAVKSELQRSQQDRIFIEGIGAQKRTSTDYDVDILRAEIPKDKRDIFMSKRVVYEVNQVALQQLVRMQEIDGEVVKRAESKKETLASLPGTPKTYVLPPLQGGDT